VATLGEAVQIIGLREIQDLVLATAVINAFKLPPNLVDVASFWKHSIACGLVCGLLAEDQHDPQPERFFVGGLLHDIGRLMLFLKAPEEGRQILQRSEKEGMLASRMEREIMGFDHAELGAELVSFWKLPHSLKEMVGCHHNPSRSHTVPADVFLVHYADFITSVLEFGNSGEFFVAPLTLPKGCDHCLVSEDRLTTLAKELEIRCAEIFPILVGARND
jgi:putative nucleotidyltransferase with HDIG domain